MSELFFPVLVDGAAKATLLLAAAAAVDLLARRGMRTSAAFRHFVWTLAFAGVLLVVPLAAWLPRIELGVLPAAPVESLALPPLESSSGPAGLGAPAGEPTGTAPGSLPEATAARSFDARLVLTLLWAAVASLGALRLVVQASRIRRLHRGALRLPVAGAAPVFVSEHVVSPLVAGLVRPLVLVPTDFPRWEAERAASVLAHEFAHVRRRDPLTSMVVALAGWLCWFHPLAWYGRRRFRLEREQACDDAVIASGTRRDVDYAADLLAIARAMPRPVFVPGALGMASRPELEVRLRAILDGRRARRPSLSRGAVLGSAVLALAGFAALAPLTVTPTPPSVAALLDGLGHREAAVRAACLEELEDGVTRKHFSFVVPLARDESPAVRRAAIRVLRRIGCLPAMLAITCALDDDTAAVRLAAAEELGHFHDRSWWRAREPLLRSEIWGETETLVDYAISARSDHGADEALRRACADRDPTIAAAARDSLRRAGLE